MLTASHTCHFKGCLIQIRQISTINPNIFPPSVIYLNVVLFPVIFNHAILLYPETSAIKDRAETLHVNLRHHRQKKH